MNNVGKLELSLNSKNAPDLRISEGYRDMLKEYDRGDKKDKRQKEAVLFIKQKNRCRQMVHRCHQATSAHIAEHDGSDHELSIRLLPYRRRNHHAPYDPEGHSGYYTIGYLYR